MVEPTDEPRDPREAAIDEPRQPDAANVDPDHPTAPDEPIEGAEGLPDDVRDGDASAGDDEPD